MAGSRSFKIALLLSGLIHMGVFMALDQEQITRRILSPPAAVMKVAKSKPEIMHFELVDTPASAATPAPPEKTNLMSDKNTRAQDRFAGEKKLKDSPHMEGRNEESKDTRPRMIVPEPPAQPRPKPKTAAPPQKKAARPVEKKPVENEKPAAEKPKEAAPEISIEREPHMAEPVPEPEQKEVIQLAKKEPEVSPSTPAMPPQASSRVVTAASSRNTDADAQITGELSYAASRQFFGEYLLKMKQAVERQWISHLVTKYTGIVGSKAVIDFKIQPDGSVTDLAVNSSEGDPYFPLVCVSSINDAQPFGAIPYSEAPGLPDEFVNKPLNIRFTFRYN